MFGLLEVTTQGSTDTAINFAPIILGIVAILGLIGALKGFTRGISRQLIRTITVIASVVISFFIAKGIYTSLSDFLSDKTMADIEELLVNYNLLSADADNSWLESIDIGTVMLIATVPLALVIMPLAFVICFVIISGIMLIVHAILCGIFGFRKRGNALPSRFIGMALGLVQGVAVAALLLMPIIGISTTVSESAEIIRQESSSDDEASAQLVSLYDDYVKSIGENPASKALGSCGINALYKSIATVKIDGQNADMTALVPDITAIAGKITALRGVDFTSLTSEDEARITEMFDVIEKNTYLTRLLAGCVKMLSYTYTSGVIEIAAEPPISTLLDSTVSIFHTADSTNIHGDIDTICEVVFILSRDGVLTSFKTGSENTLDAFTKRDENGTTVINKLIETIKKNERTKPLITMLTQMSVSVMSEKAGLDDDSKQSYENIKNGINEKTVQIKKENYATHEEYVEAVSLSLDEILKENSITLEKGVVDNMAKKFADNYSDSDYISDDEINDIIINYYDSYLEYMENQNQ